MGHDLAKLLAKTYSRGRSHLIGSHCGCTQQIKNRRDTWYVSQRSRTEIVESTLFYLIYCLLFLFRFTSFCVDIKWPRGFYGRRWYVGNMTTRTQVVNIPLVEWFSPTLVAMGPKCFCATKQLGH